MLLGTQDRGYLHRYIGRREQRDLAGAKRTRYVCEPAGMRTGEGFSVKSFLSERAFQILFQSTAIKRPAVVCR